MNKSYTYSYDALNRLTDGVSGEGYTEQYIDYDLVGNIQHLTRQGSAYTYNYTGNQLQSVTGLTTGSPYGYDANGNVNYDARNQKNITYNLLNLPQSVTATGFNLTYTYDAGGRKLRKNNGSIATDYISGIQYENGNIIFIQTEEGRAINSGGSYLYEYTLADHLGNSRVSFDQNSATAIRQQDDYYPFGMEISRGTTASPKKEYLYNKKELQEELGQYDYGARFYDPVIARWTSVDPLAEKFRRFSPYNYAGDNPVRFIDPDGMAFKPTPQEAAAIADNSYDPKNGNNGLIGGWKRSSAESGLTYNDSKTGLKSGLYERTNADGKTEYTYATGETHTAQDAVQDVKQLSGNSEQYAESVGNAKTLNRDLAGSELTFVGHSLGGGEAAANAEATGRDAITFNSAGLSGATKSNLGLNQSATIDNYDVKGQALAPAQGILGLKPEGTNHIINPPGGGFIQQVFDNAMKIITMGATGIRSSVSLHLMDAVKSALGN